VLPPSAELIIVGYDKNLCVSLAVDKNSVNSVSKQYSVVACETSLRYHLNKLNMDELIRSNENILLQNDKILDFFPQSIRVRRLP